MKRSLLILPVVAALAAGAAGIAGAFSPHDAHMHMHMHMPAREAGAPSTKVELHRSTVRVTIRNFKFVPARVVVSPGTRVVWVNRDSDPHTVTSKGAHFGSPALDTGRSYARRFGSRGTVHYICTIHPFMHGTVVVKG